MERVHSNTSEECTQPASMHRRRAYRARTQEAQERRRSSRGFAHRDAWCTGQLQHYRKGAQVAVRCHESGERKVGKCLI